MKTLKAITISILLMCFLGFAQGQQNPMGQVFDHLQMKSSILNKDVNFAVYLPPDYSTSNRSYPVVYLLHGYGDDQTGWVQFGEISLAVDKAIAAQKIPPMIIVMPDAETTWYINDSKGVVRYEDMFIQELIPYAQSKYRIKTDKRYRGICGLSMGGYGTLIYALHHPDMFAAAAPFSAAVFTADDFINMPADRYNSTFGKLFGPDLKGDKRITDHWKKNSPIDLMRSMPEDQKKAVRYYIDCGDDDFLSKGNCLLHMQMLDSKIPHEFRVRDGAHNWTYWRTGIIDALAFIGESFHQQ